MKAITPRNVLGLAWILAVVLTPHPVRAGRVTALHLSAMPVWIYNGFTTDSDGESVQGSDTSPLRMTFGIGLELDLGGAGRLEPHLWVYTQEYAALREHDKTVPTQIETGSAVGDIVNTLGIALSLPWLYTLPWPANEAWRVSAGGGITLIFRIPLEAIDGSDASPVTEYWIAGRFFYPHLQIAADYRLTETMEVGAGLEWYIPAYNLWVDNGEDTPFLDETMVRFGLRLRHRLGSP
ncbi:hypothetical protein AU468_07200 [Alkalispirochaeta sphaeroplastigenens]|uniref:Outer membrane protein beta-barrel domain-containing protein n=1 Tax=Alkalispirochaeta sphaeroplastigenens TaxID=1187066 RepID=A0A2S4JRB3_9SPIO|nr:MULTISPECIES: hypothetical protein [Alkalispirochaeta]POR02032.1 hypothetical protein AU468_07200 [Alkalispirochaeta sphaeroplastigenens]